VRVAVLAAVVVAAGCGGSAEPSPSSSPKALLREWKANVAVVIQQLRSDVDVTQVAGTTSASANAALRNESDLYALLVAYTDLGGCHRMVVAAGTSTPATERVDRLLASACGHAERASSYFTRAVRTGSGGALLAGAREARRSLPALVRAAAALDAVG
jgi:hypothetical protein